MKLDDSRGVVCFTSLSESEAASIKGNIRSVDSLRVSEHKARLAAQTEEKRALDRGTFEHSGDFIEARDRDSEGVGLWYDSDRLTLSGVYLDEITAYRARKRWIEALEMNFLLEERHDFSIKVRPSHGGKLFKVRCDFQTACGRYAFWRLTHHQAPEVQFLLETAHLPHVGMDDFERVSCSDVDDFVPLAPPLVTKDKGASVGTWDQALRVMRLLAKTLVSRGSPRGSKDPR
jgi:hypothetical protein